MGLDRLQRAEFWGGPFDGQTMDCAPAPNALGVWEEIGTSALACHYGPHPEPANVHRFLGTYVWTDPERLTWRQAAPIPHPEP